MRLAQIISNAASEAGWEQSDTFYLEDAVIALQEFFADKKFDASVQVIEGGDHGTVMRPSTIRKMDEKIAQDLGLENQQRITAKPDPR